MPRIRVMIAEDHEEELKALAEVVACDASLEVVGLARDAAKAVSVAKERRPDVALMDVRMPRGGGAVAARGIREVAPQTRVIALSAHGDRDDVVEMIRAGAVGFILKGIPLEELSEEIHRAMDGQAILSRRVTVHVVRELADQLERAEEVARRLRALDEMKRETLQILSHELLTPCTVIQGAVELLTTARAALPPERVRDLETSVGAASSRLQRLVAGVATAAGLDHDSLSRAEPTSLRDLWSAATAHLEGRLHRLRPALGTDPDLALLLDRDLALLLDRDLAPKALVAVLENALEFSPEDESVEVEVVAKEPYVEIRVCDRGPGVPEDLRDRIFDLFAQADSSATRAHGGLGLGLYLARAIMHSHGGEIEVSPRAGGGSVFTLSFRAAEAD